MSNSSDLQNSRDLYRETLLSRTKKNTPYFCDITGNFLGKCVSVYDGNTVNIIFNPFGLNTNQLYRFRTQLLDIGTYEKEKSIVLRKYLRDLILDKLVYIKCLGFNKDGILLAYIYTKPCDTQDISNSVNQMIINKGYEYSYEDDKKKNN